MIYNLPEAFKPALRRLVAIRRNEFEQIRAALAQISPTLKPPVAAEAAQKLLSTPIRGCGNIIDTVHRLSRTRVSADVPVERFVADVTAALWDEPGRKKVGDRTEFGRRLAALLDVPSVAISARANDVQHEYAKVFDSARILTDIRPVFSSTGTTPLGALVIHNLKITFYGAGEYEEQFYALDNADLMSLKKAIERAEGKTASMEKLIRKAGVEYFESK